MSFWEAFDFWRDPVLAVMLAGALCGYLGVFVLLRRVVFVGAALTQISGAGVALALWLASVVTHEDPHGSPLWLSPPLFSLAAAVLGAVAFSLVRRGRALASETVVGVGWIVASAALLLVLASPRIVQEAHEVDDLLYGTAVLVSPAQLRVLAAVVAGLLLVHLAFHKELLLSTYDGEMARALGVRASLWDVLLFATFGVGISFAVRVVGALPAFGALVLPAAAAQLLVTRVRWMFPLAVLFGMAGGALGYYYSFTREAPTGAAIVAASALFLVPGVVRRVVWR